MSDNTFCKLESRTASLLLMFANGYIKCLEDMVKEHDDDIWAGADIDGIDYDLNFYKDEFTGFWQVFVHKINPDRSTGEQITSDLLTMENI